MKTFIVILIVLGIGIFAGKYFSQTIAKEYRTEDNSIFFTYPSKYFLDDSFTIDRSGHTVTLTESTIKQGQTLNRDNVPSIAVRVYEKGDMSTLDQWLTLRREDSWVASKGSFKRTTLSGFPALTYEWAGAFSGDAFAVEVGSRVYVFTVSYKAKTDMIRTDFYKILSSLELKKM